MRNKKKFTPYVIALVIIAAGALGGYVVARDIHRGQGIERAETSVPQADDTDWSTTLQYNGDEYVLNDNLTTVLFMGVDSEEEPTGASGQGGRSDTLLLLILNDSDRTVQALQISRDTMTEVDVYNNSRTLMYSGVMQINMQYSFGDNAARSCQITKQTVEELLYGMPIDHYISMTLPGIGRIVDSMGGIALTMAEDWTDVDPAYTAGATVTLDGAEAEEFVRYRDTDVTGSNNERIDRQSWFIRQFVIQIADRGGDALYDMYEQAQDAVETDMTADFIKAMADYTMVDTVLQLPGETVAGEQHDEFYVDEDALQQLIVEAFYTKVD